LLKRRVCPPESAQHCSHTAESRRIVELESEVRKLREANEILRRVACHLAGVDSGAAC
jgi:hypothetical protein